MQQRKICFVSCDLLCKAKKRKTIILVLVTFRYFFIYIYICILISLNSLIHRDCNGNILRTQRGNKKLYQNVSLKSNAAKRMELFCISHRIRTITHKASVQNSTRTLSNRTFICLENMRRQQIFRIIQFFAYVLHNNEQVIFFFTCSSFHYFLGSLFLFLIFCDYHLTLLFFLYTVYSE